MIVTRGIGSGNIVTSGLGVRTILETILSYINKTHKRIITTFLR